MSTLIQCNPFQVLKDVIREKPKAFKMIDTKILDHYKNVYKALQKVKSELSTIKYSTIIERDIRTKRIVNSIENSLIKPCTWFKEDRLTINNQFLKQFDCAVEHLINEESIIAEEIEYLKESKERFIEWLSMHKELIGFTYFLHQSVLPILNDESTFNTDEKISAFIDTVNEAITKIMSEIEMIEIYVNQREIDHENKESKILNLQRKIDSTGNWR